MTAAELARAEHGRLRHLLRAALERYRAGDAAAWHTAPGLVARVLLAGLQADEAEAAERGDAVALAAARRAIARAMVPLQPGYRPAPWYPADDDREEPQ